MNMDAKVALEQQKGGRARAFVHTVLCQLKLNEAIH